MTEKNMKKPIRSALGRGLSSLISSAPIAPHRPGNAQTSNTQTAQISVDSIEVRNIELQGSETEKAAVHEEGTSQLVKYVSIDKIENNPKQPRQDFSETELEELSQSIKVLGLLQPILVRPQANKPESYQIVAGERRWRAAKRCQLAQVPVIINDFNDKQTLEASIVENVQRSGLNPIEEAIAYNRLVEEFSMTQAQVAEAVGKDRTSIANILRLTKLPNEVQENLREGKISIGHAKAILSIKDPAAQISLTRKAINEQLSVRALEVLVGRVIILDGARASNRSEKSLSIKSDTRAFPEIIDRLRNALGTKVNIRHTKTGKGKIEIEYFSEQELDRLVEQLSPNFDK
jgi:ParB family transcriptional regulator, chromosome partitioning protein